MSNLSSIPTQIRDQFRLLSPPCLSQGLAEKFGYTIGLCSDLLLEKAFQSTTIRIPGAGDPSQIPYLANDRVLVQGPAEPNASFLGRCTTAFRDWKLAGSRVAVLRELQAYMQGQQPGVSAVLPEMTIVGGNATASTWSTLYQDSPIGATPTLTTTTASPGTWNWDGTFPPWRSFLILYMYFVPTGQSGTGATATAGTSAGVLGQNVNGVWVPGTSGPLVNPGSVLLTGMSGLVSSNAGQWITLSGGSHSYSDGQFYILEVASPTSCYVANPNAPGSSVDTVSWSIGHYPYIGPGPVYGTPGVVYGQGESSPASVPVDTGSNIGGVWQPTTTLIGNSPTLSWGLSCSPLVIQQIRMLLRRWKSATTYYLNIVVAFDGGTGAAGSAYSPNSSQGNGNPDGTFGPLGKNVAGVWSPNRLISSPYDCYCQGTGTAVQCSVENVT